MEENNSNPNKTEWNLSLQKIQLIAEQQARAFYYMNKGKRNYGVAFKSWKNIRLLITNRLNSEELAKAKELELNVYSGCVKVTTTYNHSGNKKQIRSVDWTMFAAKLEEYIEYISFLLRRVGLDIKEKGQSGMF